MKKIIEIHKSLSQHWVGDGFPVHTILSSQRLGEAISPFLLLDEHARRNSSGNT